MAALLKGLVFFTALHFGVVFSFAKSMRRATVPQDADPGHIILSLAESGVKYSIGDELSKELSKFFTLTDVDDLITTQDISELADKFLSMCLDATDGTSTWKEYISIHVISSGNVLVFQQSTYTGTIKENEPENTIASGLDISVKSQGFSDQVTFSIVTEKSLPFVLEVNGNSVQVKATQSLDRELTSHYKFKVQASNRDTWETAQTTISIIVVDDNDNFPAFGNFIYTVKPSDIPDTNVALTLKAFDMDANDKLLFRLVDHSLIFEVESDTGNVIVKNKKALMDKTYQLPVSVTDSVGHVTKALISIEVNSEGNLRYQPKVLSRHRRADAVKTHQVREDQSPGLLVRVEAPSVSNLNRFTMTASDLFDLNNQNGDLSLKSGKKLDYESAPNLSQNRKGYLLNVVIKRDSDSNFRETVDVEIVVTDVNDEIPRFTNRPETMLATVGANTPKNINVFQLSATDPDTTSKVMFYMETDGDSANFNLNPTTGWITNNNDNHTPGVEYKLKVYAQDEGAAPTIQRSVTKEVSIKVGERAPQFMEDTYKAQVKEDQKVNTLVTTIRAKSFQSRPLVYELLADGNADNKFSLQQNGEILLQKTVDYENILERSYSLTVTAKEQGTSFITSATVSVTVVDENDNDPSFELSRFDAPAVNEDIDLGSPVTTVTAQDRDSGVNSELTYSTDDDHFNITNQGVILVNKPLDYDFQPNHQYLFTVNVVDGGSPPRSSTVQVNVPVKNVNDLAPYFLGGPKINAEVSEKAKLNTVVTRLQARDLDGDGVRFELDPSTGSVPFSVASDGSVRLTGSLTEVSYTLKINAKDDGSCCNPSSSSPTVTNTNSSTLIIEVIDDVNTPPYFPNCSVYSPKVMEGQIPGQFIIQVKAVDDDRGNNARLSYSLVEDLSSQLVRVDANSGRITSAASYDYETQKSFRLTVKATDNANQRLDAICTFTVLIEDINDNPPKFERAQYDVTISRSSVSKDREVLAIKAGDADTGVNGEIEYSIVSQNPPDMFRVVKVGGFASIVLDKDLLAQEDYRLKVKATDKGVNPRALSSEVDVTLTFNEGNFKPPVWNSPSPLVLTVSELVNRQYEVASYTATSQNTGGLLSYYIQPGETPETNSLRDFVMGEDQTKLKLLVGQHLDYEKVSQYKIRLVATDTVQAPGGIVQLFVEQEVTINLIDKNDEVPVFDGVDTKNTFYVTVNENAPIGASVTGIIQASDEDKTPPFNTVFYSIVPNVGSSDKFEMRDGKLFTKEEFDREVTAKYSIQIKANDGAPSALPNKNGPNTQTCNVIININDLNDNAPTFAQTRYDATIEENAIQSSIIRVTADDADTLLVHQLTYSITGGTTGYDRFFAVDPQTGTISNKIGLDYEGAFKEYTLNYQVSDTKNVATTSVVIKIEDTNDNAPVFTKDLYEVKNIVEEDPTSIGNVIVTVSATDADKDRASLTKIWYKLAGQLKDDGFLAIDRDTGEVRLLKTLDRDANGGSYSVNVIAFDEPGVNPAGSRVTLAGYSLIKITPIDINDNTPVFNQASLNGQVPEGSPVDTTVMSVSATDADEGVNAELIYSLGDGPNKDKFKIDTVTGEIKTNVDNLDRESTPQLTVIVVATDKGSTPRSASATATIDISDINDNPPKFTKSVYKTTMSESLSKGATIFTVVCNDPDEGGLFFSLPKEDDRTYFSITDSGKTGVLKVYATIDYETVSKKFFNVTVRVSDGVNDDTAYVEISVTDYNDNTPVFTIGQKNVEVSEGEAVGTVLWAVTASDGDATSPNNQFDFSIAPNPKNDGLFSVDRVTAEGASTDVKAEVKIFKTLDRETLDKHTVHILAIDKGNPKTTGTATLELTVTDINDNYPKPVKTQYRVMENVPSPALVGDVEATDADLPENNGDKFTFALPACPSSSSSAAQCKFSLSVNQNGGANGKGSARIETKQMFDREAKKFYLLPVIMGDTGSPTAVTGTNTLTITIGDENDNPHSAGTKIVNVFNYKGWAESSEFKDICLGIVYAPDLDDWDLPFKTFTLVNEADKKHFGIGSGNNHGCLMMKQGLPPGEHRVQVKVSDNKYPDAISTMVINNQLIGEEPVYNAGSIRVTGGTAEQFVEKPENGKSKMERFQELLAEKLGTKKENVKVFTVRNVDGETNTFDVRFSAHGSPYYNETKLNAAVERNRQEFADLGLQIAMVRVDECMKESCESGCTNRLVVTNEPLLIKSNTSSLVGVTSYIAAECGCAARNFTREENCDPTSCYNGGTCIKTKSGFECQCPKGFDGPRCQETHHSFNGQSWAWYPTLTQCGDSKTSFEFITTSQVSQQLLMYNGPMAAPTNGVSDFIAVELVGGYPKVTIDHGTGQASVIITGKDSSNQVKLPALNDGRWHKLDIIRTGQTFRVVVDDCKTASSVSNGNDEDRKSCEESATTPGKNKFVNVNTPLQLGGRLNTAFPSTLAKKGFDGCIKNFIHNSLMYDLHIGKTGEHENSEDGCPREDKVCGVSVDQPFGHCGQNGVCSANLGGSYTCVCNFGYVGDKCDKDTIQKDLWDNSYLKWRLLNQYMQDATRSKREYEMRLMVRTRDSDGNGVLFKTSGGNGYYARLEIVNNNVVFKYNQGSGDKMLALSSVDVGDGRWHNITVKRYGKNVVLKMDRGDGRYYAEDTGDGNVIYNINQEDNFGGGQLPDLQNSCLNDIRYDGKWFPMDQVQGEIRSSIAEVTAAERIGPGCPSDACKGVVCPSKQKCIDIWRAYECRCPAGYITLSKEPHCQDINECLPWNPCVHGTCGNTDGSFNCSCDDGWEGRLCDRKKETIVEALSGGVIAAIVIAIVVLLIIILALALWSQRRRHSDPKLILEVDPDDDMRENVVHYDEEGAGEEDQDAYDISRLSKPIDPRGIEPVQSKPLFSGAPPVDQPDVGNFIGDRLQDADEDPSSPPYDTLRLYDYEGDGSEGGSLSSLNSSSTDGSQNYDYLNDWGPKFQKLADMYGGGEED